MSGVTYYQSGRVARLQTIPQPIERETKNAIRRGQNRLRTAVGEEFRSHGVGRAIFAEGFKKGALKTILAREKVKKIGEVFEVGLRIKGIAAIVETGGRTLPHGIGASGKILSNPATGFFARGPVNHPGSRFASDDFAGRAVAKTAGQFKAEVAKVPSRIASIVNG